MNRPVDRLNGNVATGRRDAAWWPLLLALLCLLWLYRRLVAGWVLAGGDLHTYFFPYWTAVSRAFQAGELPLWNPYLFAGAPLLANSQAGVFYPLNWPLWLLAGTSLDGVTHVLHWSVLLHLGLAATTTYVLARRWGVPPWGAAFSSFIYAGSGFLGVHVEHLNQLQGLAWLPLVFLPVDGRRQTVDGGGESEGTRACTRVRRYWPAPVSVGALAMILLAGHTQMAFIAVVGLVVWRIANYELRVKNQESSIEHRVSSIEHRASSIEYRASSIEHRASSIEHRASSIEHRLSRIPFHVSRFILFLLPFGIAGLIAAAQLLPTVELSRVSVRSGGLPWREAVSFSLRPWDVPRALLPPYLTSLLLPEGVAYVGLAALALAGWGAWRTVRRRRRYGIALIVLGGMGLFLALGAYNPVYLVLVRLGVPGFVHFRAPARFLALTTLAASLLAGMGLTSLPRLRGWRRSLVTVGIAGLVFGELWLAAERMPHAAATDPRAYTDLRPATAHLVAQTRRDVENGQPPGRFLSISKTLFDAGDEVDIEAVYGATLSPDALWAYKVAVKQREVLAPNLSLAFSVPAVDGYDGGLLPLRHYVDFSRLLLPEGTLDGRLRENLQAIPDERWLSLLGARFLITDKTGDAWADDVFYDRQFQPALADGDVLSIAWLPEDFAANAAGLLYEGTGEVTVTFADGRETTLPLPLLETGGVHRVRWDEAAPVTALAVRTMGDLTLTGASLIDERTGAFYPLVLSEHFRLVHSGDVKIYENFDVLPRAFLVHDVVCASSDDAPSDGVALGWMHDTAFDPGMQVVLSDCPDATATWQFLVDTIAEPATIVHYEDSRVVVDVVATSPGVLVLTDAWYPGWHARITSLEGDGRAFVSDILRADVLFRGVPLPPGAWRVTFSYEVRWVAVGAGVSITGLAIFAWYVFWHRRHPPGI